MNLKAWKIKSWPTVNWRMPAYTEDWPSFRHVVTELRESRDREGRCVGETIWMSNVDGRSVAAAWEWIELRPGVVVLLDPMVIVSNIVVMTDDDTVAGHLAAVVQLNRIPHMLPWQQRVQAVLAAQAEPAPLPSRMASRHHPAPMKLAA